MTIYDFFKKTSNLFNRLFIAPIKRFSFYTCGKKVYVGKRVNFAGIKNISVGNNVFFGENCRFICTRARVIIKDGVMFGPNVTVISGSHEIRNTKIPMYKITDAQKKNDLDKDIIFDGDNWIGANVTILKGVTIGKGTVIGAGSVVTKSTPPFSVVAGVPAKVIKYRNY